MGAFKQLFGDASDPRAIEQAFDSLLRMVQKQGGAIGKESVLRTENQVIGSAGQSAPADFIHFEIQALNESGTWKGYVGNGYISGTRWDEAGSGVNSQENWTQLAVTHNATSIKLDVEAPPWTNGIDDLVAANKGTTLADSTTYYVYLKIAVHYEQIDQWNDFDSDQEGTTVIVETVQSVETLFLTAAEKAAGDAETGNMGTYGAQDPSTLTPDPFRYFLLGTIVTPAGDEGAAVGQIFRDAIALESTVRGHRLDTTGLAIDSVGDLGNTGVTSIIDNSVAINIDQGTGTVTFTDGP